MAHTVVTTGGHNHPREAPPELSLRESPQEHLRTGQIVTHMLGFMGGRVPSSAQEMKARLLDSYAALVCPNIEDALSHEEEQKLYQILKRHAKKLH